MKKILWMLPLALLISADHADARGKGKRKKTEETEVKKEKEETTPESKNKELNAAVQEMLAKNPEEFKDTLLSLAAKLILNNPEAKAELLTPAIAA